MNAQPCDRHRAQTVPRLSHLILTVALQKLGKGKYFAPGQGSCKGWRLPLDKAMNLHSPRANTGFFLSPHQAH